MAWIDELKHNIETIEQLRQHIRFTPKEEKLLKKVVGRHPMSISRYYLSLIDLDDPDDPIRRMIVPSVEELDLSGSYDPSGELQNTKVPGVQHKYSSTALVLTTNRCASYCRYCFRKRLVGLPTKEVVQKFEVAAKYIREHKEINNVLISGGDPFILPTKVVKRFMDELSTIEHLDFVRFGTKSLVTFPQRILEDEELLNILRAYSRNNKRIYVVTQFNHERELTEKSIRAIRRFQRAGIAVSNQTVLLNGVNDNPDALSGLMRTLVMVGVNPYYIFQCRPVKRVKKMFQVPLYKGFRVVEQASNMLDGHSKRFRYVMSHRTGKVEIIGIMGDEMYFRYHQAKDQKNMGRFFKRRLSATARWLDDLENIHPEISQAGSHSTI